MSQPRSYPHHHRGHPGPQSTVPGLRNNDVPRTESSQPVFTNDDTVKAERSFYPEHEMLCKRLDTEWELELQKRLWEAGFSRASCKKIIELHRSKEEFKRDLRQDLIEDGEQVDVESKIVDHVSKGKLESDSNQNQRPGDPGAREPLSPESLVHRVTVTNTQPDEVLENNSHNYGGRSGNIPRSAGDGTRRDANNNTEHERVRTERRREQPSLEAVVLEFEDGNYIDFQVDRDLNTRLQGHSWQDDTRYDTIHDHGYAQDYSHHNSARHDMPHDASGYGAYSNSNGQREYNDQPQRRTSNQRGYSRSSSIPDYDDPQRRYYRDYGGSYDQYDTGYSDGPSYYPPPPRRPARDLVVYDGPGNDGSRHRRRPHDTSYDDYDPYDSRHYTNTSTNPDGGVPRARPTSVRDRFISAGSMQPRSRARDSEPYTPQTGPPVRGDNNPPRAGLAMRPNINNVEARDRR